MNFDVFWSPPFDLKANGIGFRIKNVSLGLRNLCKIVKIIGFIIENVSLNPYQYTWLNSFAKFTDIQKNFEIDYWGVSNKNLTKKIIEYSEKKSINKNTCVYGDIFAKETLVRCMVIA